MHRRRRRARSDAHDVAAQATHTNEMPRESLRTPNSRLGRCDVTTACAQRASNLLRTALKARRCTNVYRGDETTDHSTAK